MKKLNLTVRQLDALAIFVEYTSVDVYASGSNLDMRSVLALWRKGLIMPIPSAPCEFCILQEGTDTFLKATNQEGL